MGFTEVWEFIKQTGVPGIGFLFLYFLYSKRIRWGWDYDELELKVARLEENNDRLMNSALKNAGIAQIVLKAAEDKQGNGVGI